MPVTLLFGKVGQKQRQFNIFKGRCIGFLKNIQTFLEIFRRDRTFRDDAGRKGLLAVFELLGDQGELVNSYRRKLFTLMH